jgi:hypothetical protein
MTDFSDFDIGTQAPASGDKVDKIIRIAEEGRAIEAQIEATESLLAAQKGRANEIKTRLLPDAMAEAQLSEFKMTDGTNIKVDDFVSGSLPKEEPARSAAIQFLEAEGAGAIIKNEIVLTFEKSQHNEALALADELRTRGFLCDVKSSVHPQTYLSWARDALKQGLALDAERLNLFIGRKAKYVAPKQSRAKKVSGE